MATLLSTRRAGLRDYLALGLCFLQRAWVLYRDSRAHAAMGTLKYAIGYLFVLFIALLIDHYLLRNL